MHEPRNDDSQTDPNTQTPADTYTPSAQHGDRSESETILSTSATESGLPDTDRAGRPQFASQSSANAADTADADFALLAGYGFAPGGPLVWDDWNVGVDFGQYSTFYQPQGQLAHELQSQQPALNDFSIPVPVPQLIPTPTPLPPPPPAIDRSATVPSNDPLPSHRSNSIPTIPERGHESSSTALRTQSMVNLVSASPTQMTEPSSTRALAGGPAIATRTGTKRKAASDTPTPHSATEPSPPKRASMAKPSLPGQSPASRLTRSQATVQDSDTPRDADAPASALSVEGEGMQRSDSLSKRASDPALSLKGRRIQEVPARLTTMLPAGKVFPIQLGSELFRLSGASLSSDGQFILHLTMFLRY
jgi:hypothetical protein